MRILTTVLCLALLLCLPVRAAGQRVMIWYLPHPDDETIGMADAIRQSVLAGNINYFIYFSKGENSLARHNLKGPDGTSHTLSSEEFAQARVRETLAALAALGVGPESIIFFDYPDGAIPQEAVERTVEYFAALYPEAVHSTVSPWDDHEDHQTLARALARVAERYEPKLSGTYYHVYIYRNLALMESPAVEKRPVQNPEAKRSALAEFSRWDPPAGRYAAAASSTPDLIAAAADSEYEYAVASPATGRLLPKPTPFLKVSNLGLELGLPLGNRLSVGGAFDFAKGSWGSEIALRLQDDIPLIQLVASVGYHYGAHKPYIGLTAEVGRYYFATVRHIWKADTQLGIGLKTYHFAF